MFANLQFSLYGDKNKGSGNLRMFRYLFLLLIFLMIGCAPSTKTQIIDREELADLDTDWLNSSPYDLSHPLTLCEIIEIALAGNLELFVKEQEYYIQEDQVTKLRFGLLPRLDFHYQNSMRSQNTAATSKFVNPPPGTPPPLYQIGSPRHSITWDLGFVWNLIDFGVTYFQARQADDKAVIQQYEYVRIRNSVILRTVQSYWRAVAFKQALDRANILLPEMLQQTSKLNKELEDRAYLTKAQGLAKLVYFYQREIQVRGFNDRNDSSDPTQGFEKEYENALIDLAQLMQLPPGVKFDVYVPEGPLPYELELPDVHDLFQVALVHRPELYEKDLDYRINADDATIALIQELPGVELFNIKFYDNNPFLLHNNWYLAGVRMAKNLFALPQNITDYLIAKDTQELDIRNRLLLSESILTQVNIAYILYEQDRDQYLLAKKVAEANQRVADLADLESAVGRKSKLEALQARIDAALAYNNAAKIYAELQGNIEQLNNSIGIPLFYTTFPDQCEDNNEEVETII